MMGVEQTGTAQHSSGGVKQGRHSASAAEAASSKTATARRWRVQRQAQHSSGSR